MEHVHRVNCQLQWFDCAFSWSEIFAQHAFDLERIFLDLVLILTLFAIAIEEGPSQPLLNIITPDVFDLCTFEPALDELVWICHLGFDVVEKLTSLFLGARSRMDSCVLEVPPIRKEEASPEERFCDKPELDCWHHAKRCGRIHRDNDTVQKAQGCNVVQDKYENADEGILCRGGPKHASGCQTRWQIVR